MIPELWQRIALSVLVVAAYIAGLTVLAAREQLTALPVLALAVTSALLVDLIWRR